MLLLSGLALGDDVSCWLYCSVFTSCVDRNNSVFLQPLVCLSSYHHVVGILDGACAGSSNLSLLDAGLWVFVLMCGFAGGCC
jgi:hypothetical protein